MSDWEKARDEYIEKRWFDEEPFGFDHPDTYQFIEECADFGYNYRQKEVDDLKNQIEHLQMEALSKLKGE